MARSFVVLVLVALCFAIVESTSLPHPHSSATKTSTTHTATTTATTATTTAGFAHHPHHITNLTHELISTLNASNVTKPKNRWSFVYPGPSKTDDIKDVPKNPMKMSWEEWEKLMPMPLRNDFKPWREEGFNSSHYKDECALPDAHAIAYIFEGHVWYNHTAHTNNAKYRKFWKLLGIVAEYFYSKYPKLPVISIAFSISSVASMDYAENCTFDTKKPPQPNLPYFVLARKENERLVRMPTPYFTPLWAGEASRLYANRLPWEKKNLSGCWIGATNTMPGGRARLELLAEAERLKEQDEIFESFFRVYPMTHPQKRFHDWMRLGYFDNKTFEYIGRSKTIHKQHTSYFGNFRYNFHLPGHTRGGYSRALQTLLPQATVILKYVNPWNEYYYDWLEEGKHYVSYTNETLKETILYFIHNDDKGKEIATNAGKFYEDHLTWDNILRYWEWLVLSLVKLDGSAEETRIPKTACQCHLDEKRFEGRCGFCSPHHQQVRREHRRLKQARIQAQKEAELAKMLAVDLGGEEEEDDAD